LINMARTSDGWIAAAEASKLLGVTHATLYSYVSRGLVRSEASANSTRARRYAREDVERLRRRAEERRNPDKVAAHAMHWGLPVLESSITAIADGGLYYRGHDAVALALTRPVAEVASLIWTGAFDSADSFTALRITRARRAASAPFIARAQAVLAEASARDESAYDLAPASVAHGGWRIMHHIADAAGAPSAVVSRTGTIDSALSSGWQVKSTGTDVVRASLILCADHELNVSAFTARCIASSGSSPYAVVIGGLAALEGVRHGGSTVRVERMMESLRRTVRLRAALVDRQRAGERIDGFGHPLYPNGDPRAVALLGMLRERYARSPELAFVSRLADISESLSREKPNLDFALGAVSRVLKLPPGSGLALFAVGRTIGWIGHAIEQYATGQIIRPRAKYVGVVPVVPVVAGMR
jgi:citrate synthase